MNTKKILGLIFIVSFLYSCHSATNQKAMKQEEPITESKEFLSWINLNECLDFSIIMRQFKSTGRVFEEYILPSANAEVYELFSGERVNGEVMLDNPWVLMRTLDPNNMDGACVINKGLESGIIIPPFYQNIKKPSDFVKQIDARCSEHRPYDSQELIKLFEEMDTFTDTVILSFYSNQQEDKSNFYFLFSEKNKKWILFKENFKEKKSCLYDHGNMLYRTSFEP